MNAFVDATLLRIFFGEEDRAEGHALRDAIVERARAFRVAGLTVLSGSEGFGRTRFRRSALQIDAGPRLPMVIEIVDTPERVEAFVARLDDVVDSGLMTLEAVRAKHYGHPANDLG